jgi:hypothetical protein
VQRPHTAATSTRAEEAKNWVLAFICTDANVMLPDSISWPQRLKIKRKLAVMLDRQQMNSLAILDIQHQIIAKQIFAQLTIT